MDLFKKKKAPFNQAAEKSDTPTVIFLIDNSSNAGTTYLRETTLLDNALSYAQTATERFAGEGIKTACYSIGDSLFKEIDLEARAGKNVGPCRAEPDRGSDIVSCVELYLADMVAQAPRQIVVLTDGDFANSSQPRIDHAADCLKKFLSSSPATSLNFVVLDDMSGNPKKDVDTLVSSLAQAGFENNVSQNRVTPELALNAAGGIGKGIHNIVKNKMQVKI